MKQFAVATLMLLGCEPEPSVSFDVPFKSLPCAAACGTLECVRQACDDLAAGEAVNDLRIGPPEAEAWRVWIQYGRVPTTAGYAQLIDAWQRCPERIRRLPEGEGRAADWVLDFHTPAADRYAVWSLQETEFWLYRAFRHTIQQGAPDDSTLTAFDQAFMRAATRIDVCDE